MKITEQTWNEYIDRLAQLNETAGQKMADYIARHGTANIDAVISYAHALVQKYGEGSAELACQMYDGMAELSAASIPPAEPADTASRSEVEGMVKANQESPPLLRSGVSRFVKMAASDTTLKNAKRDGTEFAWVPHGDTCAFCIMLASNGWKKAGPKTLKGDHAQHIHANCNCEYAVRFDSKTTVAGYDPEKYLAQYEAVNGDLNAIRRAHYARYKDKINAQKRKAWEIKRIRDTASTYNSLHWQNRPVTMEAVKQVKAFSCETLNAASSRQLQNAHKRLLIAAASKPLGVEVGWAYDRQMRPLTQLLTGPSSGGSVRIPDFAQPYIALHTHPDCNVFSPGDLFNFVARPNLKMLTALGHDGHVFALEKTAIYQETAAMSLVHMFQSDIAAIVSENISDTDKLIRVEKRIHVCIKELKSYGVQFYE